MITCRTVQYKKVKKQTRKPRSSSLIQYENLIHGLMPVFLSDYTDISQYHLHRGLQQEHENSIQILETHTTEGIQNQISKQFSSSEENMVKDASNDMRNIVQLTSALLIEWTMPI